MLLASGLQLLRSADMEGKGLTYPVVILDCEGELISFVCNQNLKLLLPVWVGAVA